MIKSMTGFGRFRLVYGDQVITVEIKALNSRYADVQLRMPPLYRVWEMAIRARLSESLERGKIEFSLSVEGVGGRCAHRIDTAVVAAYIASLRALSPGLSPEEALAIAMRLPDVLTAAEPAVPGQAEWEAVEQALGEAILRLRDFRREEGAHLARDLQRHIDALSGLLQRVVTYEVERSARLRARIRESLGALAEKVDENRFEQELIYYLEKLDITEEKTRLQAHLDHFSKQLQSPQSQGKALGFISQEIGREINTLGAKANHTELQQCVVQMKEALEKIKEQVLNVL